jgi:monothiol glutaredoxin
MACGAKFAYVDVLSNPEIRANLPRHSNWPTFPQLFIDGELVGGCDIMTELYQQGELKRMVQQAIDVASGE